MKKKIAIGAAALVALGGGGVAYGVTQSGGGNERQAFLNDLAQRLKVTPDQLNNALKGAFEDRLQAAVQAGKLTQAQADAIRKKVEQGGGPPVFGLGGGPPVGRGFFFLHRGPGGPVKAGLGAAARYLGLTDMQLLQKLRSGKSLADIAGDRKKSVDGLKNAIRDSVKTDLDAAVKDQRLTRTQENKLLGALDNRLDALVNRRGLGPGPKFRAWGAKRGGMRFGAGPPVGPPPGFPII